MKQIQDFYEHAAIKLIKEKSIASEELTAQQLATAIIQAIECGDFTRLVRVDNQAQQVIYIPFAREQELLSEQQLSLDTIQGLMSRISELERALERAEFMRKNIIPWT